MKYSKLLFQIKYAGINAFILLAMINLSGCSDHMQLIKNGKSDCKIFVADDATQTEKYAASELQKYLKEMSGCEIPIINNAVDSEPLIYIGFNGLYDSYLSGLDVRDFGVEEYIIRRQDKNLIIAGGQPRGTLYGVIGFLSDHLNCRWYTRDVTKIPKTKTITLGSIEDHQKPVFEYREAWYKEAYETEWAVHNRLNPSIVPIPDSLGGSYITHPFVHTFYQLVSPESYFETHPEYFSLIKGKRQAHEAQLCLTNPEVLRIATETVMRWISERPEANVFSVDQNDGYGWCECQDCLALDEAEGSHAATVLNFANQVTENVTVVHPDIKIQTLAYAYTEIPPKSIRPHPNLTIRMCHYNYCAAHAMEECDHHNPFIERMEAWNNITNRITIWDYYTDFSHYLLPFPNFGSMKTHPRFYADRGCIGLFAQGSNVPDHGGGEFSALRAWVFAQLMWDPYRDGEQLIQEFVKGVYGQAAPFIRQYIELLHSKVKPDSVFFSIYADPTDGGYLTPEVVGKAIELFSRAKEAAAGDPALLKRVELAELPLLYAQLYFYSTGGKGYLDRKNMPTVLDRLNRIIEENEITSLAESRDRGNIQAFIERVNNASQFITDWWLIGPFQNDDDTGLQIVFPPEHEFDSTKSYAGIDGMDIRWKTYNNTNSGYIDFTKIYQPSESGVAYAYRNINLENDTIIKVGVGSNDGVRLWINDKMVLDNPVSRKAVPNQDILSIPFVKGDNSVLIKIDQEGGGWGFYFSFPNSNVPDFQDI